MIPTISIHPGETLRETLNAYKMTQKELSDRTEITTKQINEIIAGKSALTPDTALKLEYVFNVSANFWNNLQTNHDEMIARQKAAEKHQQELNYVSQFQVYKELVKYEYLKPASTKKDKYNNLLNFFGVSSLTLIPKVNQVAFRKSNSTINHESLAAWLRCGELEAAKMELSPFNKANLIECIGKFKALTLDFENEFEQLRELCRKCGIALVYTPYFKNTYVNGATRWLNSETPLIQLSVKTRKRDVIWFTFFHELAHILKDGKKDEFIEFEAKNDVLNENEADEFAQSTLIPSVHYQKFITKKNFSVSAMQEFAKSQGVSIDILAGRLANDKLVPEVTWPMIGKLRSTISLERHHPGTN